MQNNSVFQDFPVLAPLSSPVSSSAVVQPGWQARLNLGFSRRHGGTDLRFRHEGPLRIQKPLYPDGRHCCHAVVVHPPGGIAAGDCLEMDISVASDAHALITTPSATKWYGAFADNPAKQRIDVDLDGILEWLPSETIVFNQAQVESLITIRAGAAASMFGWDLLIFGRHASGERFDSGRFNQTLKITFGHELVWIDRLQLMGADPLFMSPIGLGGSHTLATCWAIAPEHQHWHDSMMEVIRQGCAGVAWTRLHPRLIVGRQVGCPLQLQTTMQQAWRFLKQTCWNMPAAELRLWAT